ncbi:hypothetical protein FOCG_13869 [Fusarium oxysporum f. sp. radicis-lycopersici 26381]|nr:hypothetical protein FOCG_13869 [Fusarium oxysporum f. sp. radicis-lycopersici 26381]
MTVKIWEATTGRCQATLVVGEIVDIIQFDVVGARLVTNHGTFDLAELSLSSSPNTPMPTSAPLHHSPQYQGYGISADRVWVTYRGRNLLWLPSAYRPCTSAIAASSVALGCRSGRVLLFRFLGGGPG